MTYTFNDDGIFVAVPESKKLVIRRPEHMSRKQWAEYAAKAADSLNCQYAPSMKLVDILARELKAWPEGVSCLSQLQHNGAIINGKGYDGREWARLQIAEDTPPAGVLVTEAEWQAAVDALKADRVEYSPAMHAQRIGRVIRVANLDQKEMIKVGEKVEVVLKGSTLPASLQGWKSGDIVECVARVCINGMDSPLFLNSAPYLFSTLREDCYRPIRTAEQIATEEHARRKREDAINLMVEVSPLLDKGWSRKVCAALYDAGCSLPVNTGK